MEILKLHGSDIEPHWQELAELRIRVFRDYPYLYEGTMDYEREYLSTYWRSPGSRVILLRAYGVAVGASTCLPLIDEGPEFRAPFEHPQDYFYLGESVLLPEYRGQRWGHFFFDEREERARQLGYARACFCAVEREPQPGHRSLEPFWRARGYTHHPELRCSLSWKDVGADSETPKQLSFWLRNL
ncbi:MAG: GNAT family N-acetyltransferase [Candidatus Eremiobacteraeota bacterium]|nr:GNAT family N-acetyltransferase [Candidatus Eremiobacteraeota bacterium]MCW5868077.1 GNAT family N-acetyltransferase [Candidatus Eremiobacteraeota bacterium]